MLSKLLLALAASTTLLFYSSALVKADDASAYQCAGTALAKYMNAIIAAKKTNGWKHIRLLSPVFNIGAGDGSFLALYNGMKAANASFFDLDGIAVNAYDVDGHTIMEYVNKGISDANLGGRAIYITEMGMIETLPDRGNVSRSDALQHLKDQIAVIKATSTIQAALIFNPFNPGNPAFTYDYLSDEELHSICGGIGNCGKIGANSAKTYTSGSGFYNHAGQLGMGYSLEIATTGYDNVVTGVRQAQSNGVTPIIRIGTTSGSGGFDDVNKYIDLLSQVDASATGDVFAIAGPNEPNAETWYAPQCNLPGANNANFAIPPARNPIAEGFTAFNTPCNEVKSPEFDPSRPYPGSPCNPLIPQSWPEGNPVSFACGKSLNVQNDVTLSNKYPVGDLPSNPDPNQAYWCDGSHTTACVVKPFAYNVTIDLAGGTIPIVGNTQDHLDDATRVNQYLLSYLGGTVQQADQKPIDKNDPSAIDRLINFAGPLKKLLSFDSQITLRKNLATGNLGQGHNSLEVDYHNYIVGCQKHLGYDQIVSDIVKTFQNNVHIGFDLLKLLPKLLTISFDNLKTIVSTIASGYQQTPAKTTDQIIDDLIKTNILDNSIDGLRALVLFGKDYWVTLNSEVTTLNQDAAVACGTTDHDFKRLTDIAGNPPPNPKDFPNFDAYWNKYLQWRGGWTAGRIPLLNNPFDITSVWASLFQNVPFSTLEDTVGEYTVAVTQHQPDGVITNDPSKPITLTISNGDSRLSIPHIRAIDALAALLQEISAPKGTTQGSNQAGVLAEGAPQKAASNPEPQKIDVVSDPKNCNPLDPNSYKSSACDNSSVKPGETAPPPLFETDLCDLKDVRINPGDDLYGKSVTARLTYYQKFTYTPVRRAASCIADGDDCEQGGDLCCSGQCNLRNEKNPEGKRYCAPTDSKFKTEARVAVFTKIPLMEQIYGKLVTSSQSVLSHFLPGSHAAFKIKDGAIPAAVNAHYSSDDAGSVTAGDKSGGAQVYIPRLGSIFDYIMGAASENMNLQRMLRPQGIGGNGSAGLASNSTGNLGSCPVPPANNICDPNDSRLQLSSTFGDQAPEASTICWQESRGQADAVNKSCLRGGISADYSVGLFQINMLSHPAPAFLNSPEGASLKEDIRLINRSGKTCYEAFSNWQIYQNTTNYKVACIVGDQTLLDTCVKWFQDPINNAAYVKWRSGTKDGLPPGSDWQPWQTDLACMGK